MKKIFKEIKRWPEDAQKGKNKGCWIFELKKPDFLTILLLPYHYPPHISGEEDYIKSPNFPTPDTTLSKAIGQRDRYFL